MQDGSRTLTETDLSVLTTTKQTQLGAVGVTEDGRQFRYVSIGGTTTVAAGALLQAAVATTNSQGLVITATGTGGQIAGNLAAGSTQLVVTNGGTSFTQDQFAEGFLEVLWSGGPISYRVRGNTASTTTNGFTTIFLVSSEPLRNTAALVPGTDTVNLQASPYSLPIVTTTVNVPIGVTVNSVVNSSTVTNYGWVQTHGEVMGTGDGSSIVIGNTVGPSTTTAGDIGLAVTTTKAPIGWSRVTSSTGGAGVSVVLNIN